MNIKSIGKAYQDIMKFNRISGVLNNPTLDTLDLYNSLSFEECSESIEAYETQDAPNILKEAIDEFYVICGKLQILEAMGMNVQEGIKLVCDNNLEKYIKGDDESFDWPTEGKCTFNKEYNVFVIRNAAGKIMKPSTYKKVDLSHLVPVDFFGKEAV